MLTVGALFQCFIFQAYGWNWMTVPLYSFLSLFLVAVLSHAKYIFNEHVAETDNFKLHLREQSNKPIAEKWPPNAKQWPGCRSQCLERKCNEVI